MPTHVGNHVVATGPDEEIRRFIAECFVFPEEEDEPACYPQLEPDFQSILPVDVAAMESAGDHEGQSRLHREHWGTKCSAYEGKILAWARGYLDFEFLTAGDMPEPVFRELGKKFPSLHFDIAAIGPSLAVTGSVCGGTAHFEDADFPTVYERVYKEPLEVQ